MFATEILPVFVSQHLLVPIPTEIFLPSPRSAVSDVAKRFIQPMHSRTVLLQFTNTIEPWRQPVYTPYVVEFHVAFPISLPSNDPSMEHDDSFQVLSKGKNPVLLLKQAQFDPKLSDLPNEYFATMYLPVSPSQSKQNTNKQRLN